MTIIIKVNNSAHIVRNGIQVSWNPLDVQTNTVADADAEDI